MKDLLKMEDRYEANSERRWRKWIAYGGIDDVEDREYDLFEVVERKMLLELIDQCAREVLGQVQFRVYKALFVDGYGPLEASKVLNISPQNVRKTRNVLIKKLRKELKKRGIIVDE